MRKSTLIASAAACIALAACSTGCTMGFYSQDAGEVAVVRAMGGKVVGSTSDAGFHATSPLNDVITYSARNNILTFGGEAEEKYDDGGATGPAIACNDAGGASFSLDLQVNYSLDPEYAESLYSDYGRQETYVQYVAVPDVRSVAREVAGRFPTIDILTNRGEFSAALSEALASKWEGSGVDIEQVSVQDVRYPSSITDRYAEAQAAQVAQQQAQAEQETARIEAETLVIEAQGEADANAALSESLTPEVIQQHYIDALAEIGRSGNLVVVPEGSQPVVGTVSDSGEE